MEESEQQQESDAAANGLPIKISSTQKVFLKVIL